MNPELLSKALDPLKFIYHCFEEGYSFDPWDIRVATGFSERDCKTLMEQRDGRVHQQQTDQVG